MKHLVAMLAMFLLMGSQTLAQQNIPDSEILENLKEKGFLITPKPVICGPKLDVLKKLEEFNELPVAVWVDISNPPYEKGVLVYANLETGTSTIIEDMGSLFCIISQGIKFLQIPASEKIKGMPIKYLTN
jgi:hypothetical protein